MAQENREDVGKRPIPGEAPAGKDIRDQEDFLELQAEVNRSQTVSSGERATVDWQKVRSMAGTILGEKSKDLLVASYLAVALSRTGGPPGVLAGLRVMRDVVGEYWESLFPPIGRLRARRNALSWWMDQMQELLPSISGPPLSAGEKGQCTGLLRELDSLLGERDPEGPSLRSLLPLVEGLPEQAPEAASAPPEPNVQSGAPQASGTFSLPPEGDPEEIFERLSPGLLDLADRLSERDPADCRALFLSRTVLWEAFREMPENDGGSTRIPPPPSHLLSAYSSLLSSGALEDLLRFCLSRQAEVPFLFELSFRGGRILGERGAEGRAGEEALRGALRTLFARLPGLARLSFSGGEVPFLSEEGQGWVAAGGGEDGETEGGEESPVRRATLPAEIRAILADGRILEACERFEEVRRREGTAPRERFLLNLDFLAAVENMGRDVPVLPLALSLLEDLERFRLDVWEPDLASRALPLVFRILSQSPDERLRRRGEVLMGRLASFDLPGAVRAFGGGR